MKFPLAVVDKDLYLQKISELLADDDCQLFIDTNIFALFFRFNSSARKEFFDWIKFLIDKQRVKTPLWAVNEYSNRFIRDKIDDYLSPLKKVNTFQKEFKEISSFLRMHVDSRSLSGTTYTSLSDYTSDLDDIEEKLKRISVAAKAKDATYKNIIHKEIQEIFESTIIPSNLSALSQLISTEGQFRYSHKLPPGFEDDKKDLNVFGDLIIWKEILEYCSVKAVKKALLITNDSKKDWVYTPNRIVENSKEKPNKDFSIVDPRLTFEFKCHTESEDFYIVNFEALTHLLIGKSSGGFIELAKALQIASSQEESEVAVDTSSEKTFANTITESHEQVVVNNNDTLDVYSANALADADFPLEDRNFATVIISQLKSYNWYRQNPALSEFLQYDFSSIIENQDNKDKLFVIGRNIYQAACGGSGVAVSIVEDLEDTLNDFSEFVANNIYCGMLYEIYFNSKNEFRKTNFKGTFVNEIFSLQAKPKYKKSIEFICNKLQDYKKYLLVLPSLNPEILDVKVVCELKSTTAGLGLNIYHNEIVDIFIKGTSVITSNFEESIDTYYVPTWEKESLIHQISNLYIVPIGQMKLSFIPTNEHNIYRLGEPKRFRAIV